MIVIQKKIMEFRDLMRLCMENLSGKSFSKTKTKKPCSNWSDMAEKLMLFFAILEKLAAAVLRVGPTQRGGYAQNTLNKIVSSNYF